MSEVERDLEALRVLRDRPPVPTTPLTAIHRRAQRARRRRSVGRALVAMVLLTGVGVAIPALRSSTDHEARVSTPPAGPGSVECRAPAVTTQPPAGPPAELASGWQRFDGAQAGLGDRGELASVTGAPDGRLVAVGHVDLQPAVWLGDSQAWSRVQSAAFAGEGQIADIAGYRGGFVAVGVWDERQTVWWSDDAVSWERIGLKEFGSLRAVAAGTNGVVAVGQAGEVGGIAGTPGGAASGPGAWRSSDGRSWTAEAADPPSFAYMDDAACTSFGFVAVGQHNGAPATWTRSGERWEVRDLEGGGGLQGIVAVGGGAIAVGWDQEYQAALWHLDDDGDPARADASDLGTWGLTAVTRTRAGIVGVGGTRERSGDVVPRMWAANDDGSGWQPMMLDEDAFPIGAGLNDVAIVGDRLVVVGTTGSRLPLEVGTDGVARFPSAPAVWIRPAPS